MICDVVVVGSGAGGAAVAGALSRAGLDVVLVEAGRWSSDAHPRNALDLEAFGAWLVEHLGPPGGAAPAGLPGLQVIDGVGGMLQGWSFACPAPHELEAPYGLDAAALESARALLGVNVEAYDGPRQRTILDALKRVLPQRPARREPQPMPVAVRHEDGALRYGGAADLLAGADIRVLTDEQVGSVLLDGDRATGVRTRERTISAGAVVVAAGTTGSPQLLAASHADAGPALGAYLHEHPTLVGRVALRRDLFDPDGDDGFCAWAPFTPERPWQHLIMQTPSGFTAPVDAPAGATADVHAQTSVDPLPHNRLTFDVERTDERGLPRVGAEYRLGAADIDRIARAAEEQVRIVAAIGELERGWQPRLHPAGASTHVMGSCRIGPRDDGTSVVDERGRLWRYRNLYVAGNAVLPRANAMNPTLTTVAVALRTADAILGVRERELAA